MTKHDPVDDADLSPSARAAVRAGRVHDRTVRAAVIFALLILTGLAAGVIVGDLLIGDASSSGTSAAHSAHHAAHRLKVAERRVPKITGRVIRQIRAEFRRDIVAAITALRSGSTVHFAPSHAGPAPTAPPPPTPGRSATPRSPGPTRSPGHGGRSGPHGGGHGGGHHGGGTGPPGSPTSPKPCVSASTAVGSIGTCL